MRTVGGRARGWGGGERERVGKLEQGVDVDDIVSVRRSLWQIISDQNQH